MLGRRVRGPWNPIVGFTYNRAPALLNAGSNYCQ